MAGSEPTTSPQKLLRVFCLAWGSVFALHAQDHVGQPVPKYTTGDECLFCHRVKVADTWQQNPHARTVWSNDKGELFLGAKLARPLRAAGYGKFEILEPDKRTWNKTKFADRCAGCHSTAVDPATREFSTSGLDCYVCHGVINPDHPKDPALARFSSTYPKNPREILSVCGSCHLRGGKSRSSGLPYPNNFVPGDNLFGDFEVDFSKADDANVNAGERHIYQTVRDFLKNGSKVTCLSCHTIHKETSPKAAGKKYEVHNALCEY